MRLDFIIPASPNPGFISQIAMFRMALDRLGGDYREARLVAVFGDETHAKLPDVWLPYFERIEIARVPIDKFRRESYAATGSHRFQVMRLDADLVFMCDADTLIREPFGQDVMDLAHQRALGGVIAHFHFPWSQGSGDPVADWKTLSNAIYGRDIRPQYRYTLAQHPHAQAPFYINLGFLAGTPAMLLTLDIMMDKIRDTVRETLQNVFDAQVALALAVDRMGLHAVSLPMRYNFPNDPIADRLYPQELEKACLIHYLRTTHFDRQRIFADRRAFETFMRLDLNGSDRVFRELVIDITGGTFPFDRLVYSPSSRS